MASRDTDRPNILLILADDQGHWAMGCAGNPEIQTPNMDRLADTGTRLDNFFCASPVCSPARASILTGRIPSQHGVHDWLRGGNTDQDSDSGPIEYLEGMVGYTDLLARQGYVCGLSGKWHLGDSHHAQKSLRFWRVHAYGGGPYYDAPMIDARGEVYQQPGYVTDVITDNALDFMEGQAGTDAPFYLSVHYTAPHSPWDRGNHPDEIYDHYLADCPFESIPFLPMHPWQINSAPYGFDERARREILSGYFCAVTAMDASIGRMLDWLEDRGLRENTLVIVTSDNGMNMGHHGIYGKGNGTFPQNMYDSSVKVPGLFSRPGHVPQGRVSDDLLSHYDLFPTLLDYVGIEHREGEKLPGQSFAPLLRGEDAEERGHVVVLDEYGPVRMIRDHRFKYVHRYPYGPNELYDLESDPEETLNLVDSSDHQELLQTLKAHLDAWFLRYVDPKLDGAREPVTGKGQIDRAGPASAGRPNYAADWHYLSEREPDA